MSTRRGRAHEFARTRERQAQLSNAIEAPPPQAEPTKDSLTQASQPQIRQTCIILRLPSRILGWICTTARWFWTIFCWFWFDKTQLITWALRVVTVLGFSYLILERIYESNLTVSIVASDPEDPFKYPFSLNNNSHMWSVSTIQWHCALISIEAPPVHMAYNLLKEGTFLNIPPGQNLNIGCPVSSFMKPPKVTSAVIEIELSYDVNIDIWLIHHLWHRQPPPTIFTWAGSASNPQWIRGQIAR